MKEVAVRLFQRQSAPEVYTDLVTGAKERIAEDERSVHFWPVWNDDLTKIANRIKERDLESDVRSRFVASLLGATGGVQSNAIRGSAVRDKQSSARRTPKAANGPTNDT